MTSAAPRIRSAAPQLAVVAIAVALLGAGACRRVKTPQEAYRRLTEAVAAGDAAALFDAVDPRTRWAWMTVQKSHREAYDIILSNYPGGTERERALRRFERGATLGSARELFIEEVGRAAIASLRAQLGGAGASAGAARFEIGADGDTAVAILPSGTRVPFRRSNSSWGFAGFADESDDRQNRALGDVAQVRTSAADYERAAARGPR